MLVSCQTYILNQISNFLLFKLWIASFEVIKDLKMLYRCQVFEQNIVLRTYSHQLTNLICLLEHIVVVSSC